MRTEYRGERKCSNANLVANVQGCTYGCLGFGDCTHSCKYDAIHVVDGLATIDYEKCIGCGACSRMSDIITIQNNLSTLDYDQYSPEKMDGLIKASQKCPQKRLLYVGKPTEEQKQAAAAAGPMTIAQADFKTTVDDMEWRG
jgi:Na+-translocating ferredoxin:NAD+ oxidoreductase subunit B